MATIKLEDLINDHGDDDEPVVNFDASKILSQWNKAATSPFADIAARQSKWLENQTPPLADVAKQHVDAITAPLRNVGLQNAEWAKQVSEPVAEFVKEHTEGVGKQIQEAARVAEPPNFEPPRSFIAAQQMTDDLARHQEQMDKILESQRREKAEAVEREKRLVALMEQQERREKQRDEQAQAQRRADLEHRRKESRRVLWTLILTALALIVSVIGLFLGG